MKIKEAIVFFENELSKSNTKKETKALNRFKKFLESLESKALTESEIESIEQKIASMDLMSETIQKKNHFGKKLSVFESFLREELKLVTKGYYTEMGVALGTLLGVTFGTTLGSVFSFLSIGLSMGISLGLLFGIVIGKTMDDKAEKEGRVLFFK